MRTLSREHPERQLLPDSVNAEERQRHGQPALHQEAPSVPQDVVGGTSRELIVSPFAGEYPDLAMDLVYWDLIIESMLSNTVVWCMFGRIDLVQAVPQLHSRQRHRTDPRS